MTRSCKQCGALFEVNEASYYGRNRLYCRTCRPKGKYVKLGARLKMNSPGLLLAYLLQTPENRVKMIVKAMSTEDGELSAAARNMLLAEAMEDWVKGGNKKMGETLVAKLLPQKTESKETKDIGDRALAAAQLMAPEEKRALLEEAKRVRGGLVKPEED